MADGRGHALVALDTVFTLRPAHSALVTEVSVRFTNPRSDTAYIALWRGGEPMVDLQKWVAGSWVVAWRGPAALTLREAPVPVPPGASWEYDLYVVAGDPAGRIWPRFTVEPEAPAGIYRAVFTEIVLSYDEESGKPGRPIPVGQRVSNPFRLVLAAD
jgi:hypothetical protein